MPFVTAWAVAAGAVEPQVYEAAAAMGKAGACVLIVETQTSQEQAWMDWLERHTRRGTAKLLVTPNAAAYQAMREGAGATKH